MLRAVHGNRAEALLGALLEGLPPLDPFAPATIVVGSHLVARWLAREIALARGIATGLELVTFDSFVERTWAGDAAAREAGIVAIDRRQLAAALASVLADERIVAALPAVASYLAAAPAPGDRAGPRRVQLAEHLATLTWQYALTRPDWMPAFAAGALPEELAGDDTARWQATLVGTALARLAAARPGQHVAPVPMLPWQRRRARLPPPRASSPVAVFGVSYLVRAQLEALTDLAATSEVTAYVLDPCEALWDDIAARRADEGTDPLPLALWGRAVRDTVGSLVERTGGDVEGVFVHEEGRTALEEMVADVVERKIGQGHGHGHGVAVLACPNARREIEAVAAEVRGKLDADPTLRAHEIAVWIASDAERYLALAPSAFEAVGVPCHLIDAPIDDRGRIGEAVLALLELPTGSMTRGELLRVMTHPAVLAAYPHVDGDDWVRWTEQLGIAHGADGSAYKGTYLEPHAGRFHWDQGVRRLALGAYMTAGEGKPVTIGGVDVVPEEVRPEQQASAATYALLVRSLCADAAWLAEHDAPLADWAEIFVGLVDAYIWRGSDDTAREVERVRKMLAAIAHVDLDGRRVGFREAREHALRRLVRARADRGEPLAAGVMIAPLTAMRAIPARFVFVVGLAEGAFPATDPPSPLDIRRVARAGDVAPRDRDRHAFLEVLLGTRDALTLSYVAVEPKSGEPLAPSSVVLELCDALAPYLGVASSRAALDQLVRRVPLHRFAATGGELPAAVARERWAVRVRDALRAHLRAHGHAVPEEDGLLALLQHDGLAGLRGALGIVSAPPEQPPAAGTRTLSLANLRAFLESPVQAWAQAVLGLDELPDDEVVEHSDEPFHVERPVRAQVLRAVLAAHLRDPGRELADVYDTTVRDLELRGKFPVGVFGSAARTVDLRTLERWRAALGPIEVGSATRLAFGRSQSDAELLPPLELTLSGGRTVRLVGQTELLVRGARATSVIPVLGKSDRKSRYHLRGALDHVVLAAAGLAPAGHEHVLLAGDGKRLDVEHAPWTRDDARRYLAELVGELVDHPHGYLLPFDQLVRALDGERVAGDARNALGFGPLERTDGLGAPADAAAIAQRRFAPLASRMQGFGGKRP